MKRRGYVRDVLMGVVGGVGTWAYLETDLADGVSAAVPSVQSGPAPEELEELKTVDGGSNALFRTLTFYNTGHVDIEFKPEDTFELFALGHVSTDVSENALGTWDTPKFEGPVRINMKRAVNPDLNYPNRQFKLKGVATQDEVIIMNTSELAFVMPAEYME